MNAATAVPGEFRIDELPSPAHPGAPWAAFGLVRRDLLVLAKEWPVLVIGAGLQPLLLVFVFTYVLPKAGFALGGPDAGAYAAVLVAGVVGLAIFMQGFQSITIRFAIEFGYTREIEDRVLAPLPLWALGLEKVLLGALQAALAGAMVFPIAAVVPATPVPLHIDVGALLVVGTLACVLAAAVGLAIGTVIDPGRIQLAATALLLPMTFLGAVYYPWAALEGVPWLKVAELANPLVYMNEALRAVLTEGVPHMPLAIACAGMVGFTLLSAAIGIRGFYRRALS
jgi:ABC-2 type transport system permease protein